MLLFLLLAPSKQLIFFLSYVVYLLKLTFFQLYLTPDVRYNLQHGEEITFADVKCSYIHANKQVSCSIVAWQ
jgi:hypothetical protein